jgi:hypothetical protein
MGMYLMDMYLMGVHHVHLIGVHPMDVHLMNMPLSWASLAGMHLPLSAPTPALESRRSNLSRATMLISAGRSPAEVSRGWKTGR